MTAVGWFARGFAAAILAVGLGVAAAWPIYRAPWLLVVAAAGILLGGLLAAASARWKWPPLVTVLVLLAVFAATVVPVAEPQRLSGLTGAALPELWRGVVDGLASVVLGWKQLLTLTLPVGTYQAVLVPAYLVFLLSTLLAVAAARRGGRIAPLAAAPLLAPVAFGTVFGAAEASAPLSLGVVVIPAPREIALWCAAGALAAIWVVWSSGVDRRAALRRGRITTPAPPGSAAAGRATRWGLGLAALALALIVALTVAPLLEAARGGSRAALRDRIDPRIVLRERPTPLAGYRVFKRDDALDAPLFSVSADGATPARLRLAVLDQYDGVDFHVGIGEAERFTRFPSSGPVADPTRVTIAVRAGYADIWAPVAGLGSVPEFSGPRAALLADSFFVNRSTGAAIAVPPAGASDDGRRGAEGLRESDGYRVTMSAAKDPTLRGAPAEPEPEIDLEAMPQMAEWIRLQEQPASADGLLVLIQRLRDRGYLSHSLSDGDTKPLWLDRLKDRYRTVFRSSPGGQSIARIEELFAQLNAQQRAVGPTADAGELVAGVGDDEQFSVAAALLARALGFDSRVVLGVRMDDPGSTADRVGDPVPGVPNCIDTCTGENLAAWIEVRGADGVWAPLDVTPQASIRPSTSAEGQRLPEYPSTPDQRDAREVEPPVGIGEPNDGGAPAAPPRRSGQILPDALRIAGLSLAALSLLALPLLFLPLAKRIRTRRRRRDPHPELRALGAWQETMDLARDLDASPGVSARRETSGAPTMSRSELAGELAGAGFSAAPLLATQTDAAVFSAAGISGDGADAMWRAVEAQRASVLARAGFWRRLRARYSLRSYGIRFAVPRRGARQSTVRQHRRRSVHGRGDDGRRADRRGAEGAPIGSANAIGKVSS